jgi:thiol:disulfide interchange protein DsbA
MLVALAVVPMAYAQSGADNQWVAGTNYVLLSPVQPTSAPPGKIEVTEVFSYACPACNAFYPTMDKLRASLPAYAVLDYVPAGFIPSEDWPVFQRAYYTARQLNLVNPRTHDQMFEAVWKTGELATVDPQTDQLKKPAPTIENIAGFYARVAHVNKDTFVATSRSFAVDTRVRQADQYIQDCQVDQTPTIIVNGKYRLTPSTAGGYDQVIALVKYLVAMEKKGG